MRRTRVTGTFRALLVAAVIATTGLPMLASPAGAATSSVGNPLQSRPIPDTAERAIYSMPTASMNQNGYIDAFAYYADRAGTVNFVVLSGDRVQYVSPDVSLAVGHGVYTPAQPIPVLAGAVAGWYAPGQNPISFTANAGTPVLRYSHYPRSLPVFAETIGWGGTDGRTYSFTAVLRPTTFATGTAGFGTTSTAHTSAYGTLAAGEVGMLTAVGGGAAGTYGVGGVYGTYGPDGDPQKRTESCTLAPSAPVGALVVSVNNGPWTFAGVGPTPLLGPGTVRLAANDCTGGFGDNTGSINYTFRRPFNTELIGTDDAWTTLTAGTVRQCEHVAWADSPLFAPASYIWRDSVGGGCDAPQGTESFTKSFTIPTGAVVTSATVDSAIDNLGTVEINGTQVQSVVSFENKQTAFPNTNLFVSGTNTMRVNGENLCCTSNPAGAISRLTLRYGGPPQSISFTSTATSPVDIGTTYTPAATGGPSGKPVTLSVSAISTPGACTWNGTSVTYTGGGLCAITADQDAGAFYGAARATHQLVVVRNPQTISFPAISTKRIGDVFTATATGGASGNPVTFATTTPSICSVTTAGAGAALATGTCSITANQAGTATYATATPVTRAFSVIPLAPTLTSVTPTSGPTSGGTTITISGTNLTGGTLNGGGICATTPVFTATTITCSTIAFVHGADWAFNVSTAGGTSNSLSFRWLGTASVVPQSTTITYGDPLPTFAWTVQGLPNGSTVTQDPTCSVSGSPATVGTYTITCSGAQVSGAFVSHAATGTLTIAPRGINVAPSGTQTYGGAPTFTYVASGMLPGDSVTGTLTCAGTTPASHVGPHALTGCTGLTVSNGSQYAIAYLPGTTTVAPAPLHVTASSHSMTYGAAAPTITPSYAGFVNGQDASVLTAQPACVTDASSASPVGTYVSSCSSAAAANYAVTYGLGSVNVTRAPLHITASSQTLTYGGAVADVTPSFDGFVNGDDATVLTSQPVCGSGASTGSDAGSHTTSCALAAGDNYSVDYVAGSIEIQRAALGVFASSADMFEGGAVPAITASVLGLVNGDTDEIVTCSTTATAESPPGVYPTTCALEGDNYDIDLTEGTVTVRSVADVVGDAINDPVLAGQFQALFSALPTTGPAADAFAAAIAAIEAGDNAAAADALVDVAAATAQLAISNSISVEGLIAVFFLAGPMASSLGGGLLQTAPQFIDNPTLVAQMEGWQFQAFASLPNGFGDAIGQAFLAAQVAMVGGDVDGALAAYIDMVEAAAADADNLSIEQLYGLFDAAGSSSSALGGGLLAVAPQFYDPGLAQQMNDWQFQAAASLPNGYSDAIGQAFLAAQVAMVGGDVDGALAAYIDMVEAAAADASNLTQEQLYGLFDAAGNSSSALGGGLLATAPHLADPDLAALMQGWQFQAFASLPNGVDDPIGQAFLAAQVAMVGGNVDAALTAYVDMVEAAAAVADTLTQEQLYGLFDAAGNSSSALGGGLLAVAPQFYDPGLAAQMQAWQFQAAASLPNGFSDAIGQAFLAAQIAMVGGDVDGALAAYIDMVEAAAAVADTLTQEQLYGLFDAAGNSSSALGGGLLQTAPQFIDNPTLVAQMEGWQFQAAASLPNGFSDAIGQAFLAAQVAMVGGDVDAALAAYIDMVEAAAAVAGDLTVEQLYGLFDAAGSSSSALGGGLLATAPHLADPGLAQQMNDWQFQAFASLPNGFDDPIGQAFLAAQVAMVGGNVDAALTAYIDMVEAAAAVADTLTQDQLYALFDAAGNSSSALGGGLLSVAPQFSDPGLAAQMQAWQFQAAASLPNGFSDAIGQAFLAAQVAMVGGDVDGALAAYTTMVQAAAADASNLTQEQLFGLFDAAGSSSSALGGGLLAAVPAMGNASIVAEHNAAFLSLVAAVPGGLGGPYGPYLLAAAVAEVAGDVDAAKAALDAIVLLAAGSGLGFEQLAELTAHVATIEVILGAEAQEIVPAPITGAVYGGSDTPVAAGGASGNAVVFTVDASSASVCSIDGDGVVQYDHAGTCVLTATQAPAAGHAPAIPVQLSITVAPAPLTITANDQDMTYGGALPALDATFTGLVAGDTPSSVPGLTVATVPASNHVGSYAITPSGAASPDYDVTFVDGTLVITPAPLTVTAHDASRRYNTANPAFTASTDGLVNDDTATDAFGGTLTGTTAAVQVSDVGEYPIAFTGAAGDYDVTFVAGTLTVDAMPTSVTFTSSATQPAGATALSVTVTEQPGTPVLAGTVTFTAGTATSTVATTATGAATTSLVIPNGVTTVTALFSGENYVGSAASQSLTTFQPTQFVIWGGNGPLATGESYAFWGSEWSLQVAGGTYGAGGSFKGHADDVAATGQSFTARSGGSGSPPASISRYVSVLVSTSITRSGSTIAGNVVERVILRVDDTSTYKPTPGGAVHGVLVTTVV